MTALPQGKFKKEEEKDEDQAGKKQKPEDFLPAPNSFPENQLQT